MKKSSLVKGIALGSILLFALTSCGKKAEKILIDGSSTVYPITEGIAEDYRKKDSSVHVTVGISGTGGGFKKFCNGETDISDASRSIKQSEIDLCKAKNITYVELPIAYDGLAVLVNKGNNWAKELTMEQLKKIFQYENPAKSWKEVDSKFPDMPIRVFAPGQDSGTYDYFSGKVLGKKAKMRADATFSEDDNVLVTGIAGNKGSIGFFGIAYYEENKDKLGLIAVVNQKTKKAVHPTLETVKSGEYAPLSRPIFIYVNSKAKARPIVVKFVDFYLENAANISKKVGYIPLGAELYTEGKAKFKAFK